MGLIFKPIYEQGFLLLTEIAVITAGEQKALCRPSGRTVLITGQLCPDFVYERMITDEKDWYNYGFRQ